MNADKAMEGLRFYGRGVQLIVQDVQLAGSMLVRAVLQVCSLYLPYISAISPLHLPHTSPISPLYLRYISPYLRTPGVHAARARGEAAAAHPQGPGHAGALRDHPHHPALAPRSRAIPLTLTLTLTLNPKS